MSITSFVTFITCNIFKCILLSFSALSIILEGKVKELFFGQGKPGILSKHSEKKLFSYSAGPPQHRKQ